MLGGKIMKFSTNVTDSDRVSSLYIAEITKKGHNSVLRDLRNRIGLCNLVQSTRLNSQNKRYPVYFITKLQFIEFIQQYTANLSTNRKYLSKLQHRVLVENYEFLKTVNSI